jgi:hypothetical protein
VSQLSLAELQVPWQRTGCLCRAAGSVPGPAAAGGPAGVAGGRSYWLGETINFGHDIHRATEKTLYVGKKLIYLRRQMEIDIHLSEIMEKISA